MSLPVSRIQLHPEGPEFSRFIAGFWRAAEWGMSPQQRLEYIEQLLALGVTTFDHADIYGNYQCEALFGEALALKPELRSQMELVTKCGIKLASSARPEHRLNHYDTSREHILASVDNSLRNLQTDYIDLLLIHRPDPLMDADETAAALSEVISSGKVRHVGVSNFTPFQFELLQSRLSTPLVTNQLEISPLMMETLHDGSLDQCQQLQMRPMAWSCLGGGRLFDESDAQATRVRSALAKVGEALGGASIDQVAYAWVIAHPSQPLPLLGTGRIERAAEAIKAGQLTLSRQQWFTIWEASAGHSVP